MNVFTAQLNLGDCEVEARNYITGVSYMAEHGYRPTLSGETLSGESDEFFEK